MRRALLFGGALLLLQAADVLSTRAVLATGGREMNPVVNFLGLPLATALKFGVVALILLGARRYSDRFVSVLGFTMVLYAGIVGSNLLQLKGTL